MIDEMLFENMLRLRKEADRSCLKASVLEINAALVEMPIET